MQSSRVSSLTQQLLAQLFLVFYTTLAIYPVFLIIMNSFRENERQIFRMPYGISPSETLGFASYQFVQESGNFFLYFGNSSVVVVVSLFLILFFGSMMAFALSEYEFSGNTLLSLYMSVGIMIPIRLGTVSLLELTKSLGLNDSLWALIFVYTANGLPLCVFVLTSFMKQIPRDLKDAARVDGASEYRIYGLVLPLIAPALGTVAVFNIIPIWNDLWFPLILTSSEEVKTVTLGAQVFIGQYERNYGAILASLTLSMVPVIIMYILFSRQLVRGITAGAVK
jgi:raffinose/stachyose/melibiose transport system permease protein